MGAFNEIMKRIHEAANMEVADGETTRVRISIRNGKVETFTEVIPDIDSLSLEQLYELREKYEAQVDEMNEAEPDEVRNPAEYESWEEALDQLEQNLDEVNEMIEQVEQEMEI